jgi:hypothetical protein
VVKNQATMTDSSPSSRDALTSFLDAFLAAPLDGITLPSQDALSKKQAPEKVSFSLLKPSNNSSTASPLRLKVAINRSRGTSGTSTNPDGDKAWNSDLSFPSVGSTAGYTSSTNAVKCASPIGNLEEGLVSDFVCSTYRKTKVPAFVFPSLSLSSDLEVCLYNGKFFHQDSAIRNTDDVSDLLGRILVAPLPQLTRLSAALEQSPDEQTVCSKDCYLSCAIRKLFSSLIHHRLGFWIEKLQRAVALEEDDVDTNNKRVLVALLDVQSSTKVEDCVDIAFRVVRDRSHSTINAEMQEVFRMEQELADTLASMKHGAKGFEPGSPLPTFHPPKPLNRRNSSASKPISKDDTNLFLPRLNKAGIHANARSKQDTKPAASTAPREVIIKEVSVPIVMDARARVRTQIGYDLEQGHTVGFGVSGSVVGYYQESESSSATTTTEWIGMELKLNTEELYANMEKQARVVARSTAESVLLNAMTEEHAETDYHSSESTSARERDTTQSSSSSSYGSSDRHGSGSTDEEDDRHHEESKPKSRHLHGIAPIIRASTFSPPVSVSPITSPRRHQTPSPHGDAMGVLPLVSPPPIQGGAAMLSLSATERLPLTPKRAGVGRMPGSFTVEPSLKRQRLSPPAADNTDLDQDVVGALTALKNTVRC